MKKVHFPFIFLCLFLTACSPSRNREQASGPPAVQDLSESSGISDAPSAPVQEPSLPENASQESIPEETSPQEALPQDPEAEALASLVGDIITPSMTEYEKVRAIHDYLVIHVDYDYDNLAAGTLPDTAFTKEGALLHHSAVCEGYARAFSWLCDQADMEELLIYGTADDGTGVQSHAWNQVCIGGEWYNVDVTWDDPLMNGEVVTDGSNIIYSYFLVPDTVLLGSHIPESPETRHACTSERYLEENRRLTIAPYLTEPCSFADSDAGIREAVEQYLSEGVHAFQIVCDVTSVTPEDRSAFVLEQVKNTMTARQEYGQISLETQYGIADYAVISVTITD